MKIVFFGSTDFSLPIVKKISEQYPILGIVFSKPKPKGRGLKIEMPEIGKWAMENSIRIFSPENPNDPAFIKTISELQPDLFVLSAYGYILSADLLKIPQYGGINIHPSLLPKYRGAAPIQRAIMDGEKITGITIFFMDEKVDHGKILMKKELIIDENDNYGSLSNRLSLLGAEIINEAIKNIETANYTLIEQNGSDTNYAGKIKKEEMFINWSDNTEKIHNLVRALSPSPGARAIFRNRELIILGTEPADKKIKPGVFYIENKKLYVGTGDGSIVIKLLKPENRSSITAQDFINGFRIKNGERIDK